ncbi:MAG TPA: alpha/beta hydrolase-fold protein [Lacunisphaera sp.]
MKLPIPKLLATLLAGYSLFAAPAQSLAVEKLSAPALKRVSYQSAATRLERDFYVYLPEGYEQKDHWPVLMFLQGNGERGDGKEDLDYLMVTGPLFEAWSQQRHLPFVILVPQLPMFDQAGQGFIKNRSRTRIRYPKADGPYPEFPPGTYRGKVKMDGALSDAHMPFGLDGTEQGWSMIENELLSMLDTVLTKYKGDPSRVYLTGLSTGGFGTWYMAGKHPEKFAAIAPISAFCHPDLAPAIAQARLPVWVFMGGRDPYFKQQFFYPGLNELERLGDPDVRFTILADMGHDAWQRVYAGQDIYDWLLKQKKVVGSSALSRPDNSGMVNH